MNNRDQQKSFAFYTGMFPAPPTCKNKVLCVAWLKCICVPLFEHKSKQFYICNLQKCAFRNRRVTQAPHVYFSTSTFSKTYNVTCVKRKCLCWFSPVTCVLVQNCIYVICRVFGGNCCVRVSALNPDLLFFC